MQMDVDALRVVMEDETGNRCDYDYALMHRPVEGRQAIWLDARIEFADRQHIRLTLQKNKFHDPHSLGQFFVRPLGSESYRPLRNIRSDIFGIALKRCDLATETESLSFDEAARRFSRVNSWMMRCFSPETWDYVAPIIVPRWKQLGALLTTQFDGKVDLLKAAHMPSEPGTSKSWVPLSHPLEIEPKLYTLPAQSFGMLRGIQGEGTDELATLADTCGRTIPELHRLFEVSPALLMSFDNSARAYRTGEELVGFNFTKYTQIFGEIDQDASARWFWRTGTKLLGPEHYGAALGRLVDRIYDAGIEDNSCNNTRFHRATSLARDCAKRTKLVPPRPRGIQEEHALIEWSPAFFSEFARQSRQACPREFLERTAHSLGRAYDDVVRDAAFLIRLAPELLAFFLLLWELTSDRQTK
ncbi:MAG: hypothetical protein C0519_01565 [Hyphomicrobium sp.]|nr:hypothetical protein [Hyphomicrobium sp.]PPD09518.1 MAG: hypothetical protein CTY28_01540 [Hyphomicrobium sp.]